MGFPPLTARALPTFFSSFPTNERAQKPRFHPIFMSTLGPEQGTAASDRACCGPIGCRSCDAHTDIQGGLGVTHGSHHSCGDNITFPRMRTHLGRPTPPPLPIRRSPRGLAVGFNRSLNSHLDQRLPLFALVGLSSFREILVESGLSTHGSTPPSSSRGPSCQRRRRNAPASDYTVESPSRYRSGCQGVGRGVMRKLYIKNLELPSGMVSYPLSHSLQGSRSLFPPCKSRPFSSNLLFHIFHSFPLDSR